MKSRRQFVKLTGTGLLAAGTASMGNLTQIAFARRMMLVNPFVVGMAGYTFLKFSVEQSIEMMKRIGIESTFCKRLSYAYEQYSGADHCSY